MDILTGFAIYFIIWWTVLFTVLPLGIQAPAEKTTGEMPGAPADPQLKRKAIITTIISTIIWAIVFTLVQTDWISFREMAKGMD